MNENQNNSFFSKLKNGLKRTSSAISSLFTGNRVDDSFWEELEDRLILADIGPELSSELLEKLRHNRNAMKNPKTLLEALKKEAVAIFPEPTDDHTAEKPHIILVIGVNGTGKTTTIAKIAQKHKEAGEKLVLGAADTFRAAAIDQIKLWANRLDIPVIAQQEGSDPAAVAYDTATSAVATGADTVIIDTAGRLHTKHNLMEELKKICRVLDKAKSGAPHEILLVLDGTAGQNSLAQAAAFSSAVPVTSLAITKLDGTAKGGIVLRIARELNIPVKYVGMGEKSTDLIPFNAAEYVDAIFDV